tara:strand:+ start:3418 stop:3978 length:561 start_codon:yes stop_codon:yes gene_type:complete
MIVIIDLGWGNLGALSQFFKRFDRDVRIVDYKELPHKKNNKSVLVWPGVGSATQFTLINEDHRKKLVYSYQSAHKNIAICLGMQFLFGFHDEGSAGLNIFDAPVLSMPSHNIGYSKVNETLQYFNHGYSLRSPINLSSEFKVYTVSKDNHDHVAMIISKKLLACQFHPEKSRSAGIKLVGDFLCSD